MTANKYAAKISALLAKAEATDNADEAHAFTAKATELMIKHSLELADLPTSSSANDEFTRETFWIPGAYSRKTINGLSAVADALGGQVLIGLHPLGRDFLSLGDPSDTRQGHYYTVYGFQSDVDAFVLLSSSLRIQATQSLEVWWKIQKKLGSYSAKNRYRTSGPIVARNSYLYGFLAGAAAKIRETRREVISEASANGVLALRDRASIVQQRAGLRSVQNRNVKFDSRAGSAGQTAGRSADIGTKRFERAKAVAQ